MAQLGDLIVSGKARFLNKISGNIDSADKVNHTLTVTLTDGSAIAAYPYDGSDDVSISVSESDHYHGNINSAGIITNTDVTIASGDKLIVMDSSNNNKIAKTSVSFDGSTATQCLTKKGTWATFGTSNLTIGTTSTTAMAGNTAVNNVAQTATSTDATYELLFSGTADNTTRNEGARKTSGLTFNPSTGALNVSGSLNFASTSLTSSMDAQGLTVTQTGNSTTSIAYGTIGISDRSDSISMSSSDITLSSKWDGTNTSLKTAVTGAKGTVTQTATDSISADYEILFSSTADNTTRTEGTRKTQYLKFNPSMHTLSTYDSSYASMLMPNSYYTTDTATMSKIAAIGINSKSAMMQLSDSDGQIWVTTTDIGLMGTTWDGSNSNLKSAITALANRNWYTYVEFSDKNNVAANTVTNLGTWKPTVGGVYLIQYVARFSANASGYRKIYIASSATTSDGLDRFARVSVQACNGDHTYIELVAIETLTANTTYYFNAIHNASAAVNISYPGLKIMRIR